METIAGGSSELPVRWEVVTGGGRASKKQITLPSSADIVGSNDDLLVEILLRLPLISLHLFKSVSKRWLSLITDPSFTLRRSRFPNPDSPSGLFLQRPNSSFGYDFVPLDIGIPIKTSPIETTFTFGPDAGSIEILQSCNGLLLCYIRPDKFFVYNPYIKLFKMLPPLHCWESIGIIRGMNLAFDPAKSPHYKVVYAGDSLWDSYIRIETYSSETGNWSVCGEHYPLECFIGFYHGIYWNDAIHWINSLNGVSHFKLDVENPFLTNIQTPRTLDGMAHYDHKLFESRGCLLLSNMVRTHYQQLNVYEMKNGYSGWSVKYLVNLDDIIRVFPKTWGVSTGRFYFIVRCIVLGDREEDSFLVVEVPGRLIQCNIVLKTLHKLRDLALTQPTEFACFQFIASLAGV